MAMDRYGVDQSTPYVQLDEGLGKKIIIDAYRRKREIKKETVGAVLIIIADTAINHCNIVITVDTRRINTGTVHVILVCDRHVPNNIIILSNTSST